MANLLNLGDELKKLFSKAGSFIQQNPTPAVYANQQFQQRVAQPIVSGLKSAGQAYAQAIPAAIKLSPPDQLANSFQNFRTQANPMQNLQTQGMNLVKAAPLVFGAAGGVNMARQGAIGAAKTILPNALLGGGISKFTGGSFFQGVGQGVGAAPQIGGVTHFSNPLINRAVGKITGNIQNPLINTLAGRAATGALNIPEGAVINSALGRPSYGLGEAALDFGTGALFGAGKTANAKGMVFGKNRNTAWPREESRILADSLADLHDNQKVLNDVLMLRKKPKSPYQFQQAQQMLGAIEERLGSLADNHIPNETLKKLAKDYGNNTVGYLKALGDELQKSLKGYEDKGGIILGIKGQSQTAKGIESPNPAISSKVVNPLDGGITQTIQPLQSQQGKQQLPVPPSQTSNPLRKSQEGSLDEILQQAKSEIQKQPDKRQSIKEAWNKFYTDYVNRMQPVEDLTKDVEKKLKISIRPEFSPKYQIMKLLGAGGTAELRHRKELDPIIKELGNVDKSDFDVFLKASRDVELGARGIKGSDAQLAQQRIQALGTKYDLNQFKNVASKLYDYQDRGLQKLVQSGFIDDVTYKTIKGQNEAYVPFQRVMDEVDSYLGLPTKKLSQGKQPISTIKGSDRAILSPLESIIANTYKLEGAVAKNNVAKSIANLHKIDSEVGITPLRIAENVKKRIDIYTELKELGGNKNKLDRLFSTRNRWARKLQSELNRLNTEGIEVYLKRKPDPQVQQASSAIQEKQSFERPNIVTDTGDTFRGPAVVTGTGIKDVYVQPTDKEVKQLVNDLVNSPPETIRAIKSKIATRENKLGTVLDELESLRTNIDSIKSKRSELFDEAKLIQDAKTKGKDVISVWNNGIKELYEVPQDVNDVVKGLNEEQVGQVVKLMSIPANVLRQGATGRNVDFMIPNIVKDQFDAAVSSKYGYRPFIDYFNGLGEMIKAGMGKPNLYDEYAKSGGKIFYEMAGGRKAIAREIQDATVQKNLGRKFFSSLTDGLDFLGKLSETPTRVGLFKKALQGSGNKLIAASEAREGTLDFARMGAKMKTANAIIPFLNVGVQGFDKLIRNAKDNPGKMLFYGTLYGIAPQVALTVYNNTNHPQEYQEIPNDIKQDNFVLVTGRTPEGKVKYVTLSKGNVMPYITNPVDNLLSAAAGYDRQSFATLATQLLGDMLPLVEPGRDIGQTASRSLGSVIPQAIKPAIENVANFNFYKGKEIVPWYMQSKSPMEQTYDSTELPYKYIGNLIQVSPLKVKNALEGYLAGFIKTPVQLGSILQKVSRGESPSANEIPILRRFISETYDTGEQYQKKQEKEQEAISKKKEQQSTVAPFQKRLFGEVSAAETAEIEKKKEVEKKAREAVENTGKVQELEDRYFYRNENGNVATVLKDRPLEKPIKTGQKELDAKAIAQYKSDISSKATDIYTMYKLGILTQEEASKKLSELKELRDGSGSGTGRKLKGVTFKKITPKTIKFSTPKRSKIATLKIKKPPKPKKIKFRKASKPKKFKMDPIYLERLKGLQAGTRLV